MLVLAATTTTQSPWYAVVAGLGAALIVAFATTRAARQQRKADADRLTRQLSQDRELRAAETVAASERLTQQLVHDRDMRDREHLRNSLTAVVGRVLVTDHRRKLERITLEARGALDEHRDSLLSARGAALEHALDLGRDALTLVVSVEPAAAIIAQLEELRSVHVEAEAVVERWMDGLVSDEAVEATLRALAERHASAVSAFLRSAYARVGVHPPPVMDAALASASAR